MSIKSTIKTAGVTVLVLLLVFAALGPAKLQFRSGLGWQIDHFIGYFALTFMICLAWRRPLVVGAALTAAAIMLEGLQGLTPDRYCDLQGALYSAGGVVAAVLPADVFIRALGRLQEQAILLRPHFRLRWPSWSNARTRLATVSRRSFPWVWSRTLSIRWPVPL
jgi:VanZ family protein